MAHSNPLKIITDPSHPDFRVDDFPPFTCTSCGDVKLFPAQDDVCTDCYQAALGPALADYGAYKKKLREDDEFFAQQE